MKFSAASGPNSSGTTAPGKIKPPPVMTGFKHGSITDQLNEITIYLREGCGKGRELDETETKPVLEPMPDASQVLPRPAHVDDICVLPDDVDAGSAAAKVLISEHEAKVERYKRNLTLYLNDSSRFDRQRKAHLDSQRLIGQWQTGHEEAIGMFRTFHSKHHFDQILETEPFKSERTLYNAVKAAHKVYLVQDKTGIQTQYWFERAMKTAIPPSRGDDVSAWQLFLSEWKRCSEQSKVLISTFNSDEHPTLGEAAVPTLLSEMVTWSILTSIPNEGSSALFYRLQSLKGEIESKGCREAFGGHQQLLDKLGSIIQLTETEHEVALDTTIQANPVKVTHPCPFHSIVHNIPY